MSRALSRERSRATRVAISSSYRVAFSSVGFRCGRGDVVRLRGGIQANGMDCAEGAMPGAMGVVLLGG